MDPSAPLSSQTLALMDVVAFERNDDGTYRRLSPPASWLRALWPEGTDQTENLALEDRFLYLQHFAEEAEAYWSASPSEVDDPDSPLVSEQWTEEDHDGDEWLLEALASRFDNRKVLVIRPASVSLSEHRSVLQEGRDLVVAFQQLQQVLHSREIVLECLLHDLSRPLANLQDALELLRDNDLDASGETDVLDLAHTEANKLHDALQDTISEIEPYSVSSPTVDTPTDILTLTEQTVDTLRPRAVQRAVQLELRSNVDTGEGPVNVVGESGRLRRILRSLIEHALRRAPKHTAVRVRLSVENRTVMVQVTDSGPPIPQDAVPYLFERFGPGDPVAEGTGLALYFCRVAVEALGGGAGYRYDNHGPTVWIRVPKASTVPSASPSNGTTVPNE